MKRRAGGKLIHMYFSTITNKNKALRSRILALAGFLAVVFCMSLFSSGSVLAKANPRYASIVMDADTGMIIHESHADKVLHPASLVKIMTLLMTFEALERGDIKLRDRVYMSKHAASMVPSKLNIKVGSSLRVEDAIYALVTKSANDVAVALAEKIGGTESHFAVMMNRKAQQIGMSRTRFLNASGLHNSRQVSTARDMARMAGYILSDYPRYYHYFSTRNFTYKGNTYRNHNRLMESYKGMDGFKTGYINKSGFNLVASAKRNDRRIIGVVFGGRTSKSRNAHMKNLLDRGFQKMKTIIMVRNVPKPQRKPLEVQIAGLNSMNAKMGVRSKEFASSNWTRLNDLFQHKTFSKMIGEGDYDPAVSQRLETGLLAIDSVRGNNGKIRKPATVITDGWAVQIGAFSSRVKTDQAIKAAIKSLPTDLAGVNPIIAPLKTKKGWLFRGRLTGLSREDAMKACRILKECLPVSPQAH